MDKREMAPAAKKRKKMSRRWGVPSLRVEQAMDALREESAQRASMLRLVHQTLTTHGTESDAFGKDLLEQGFLRLFSIVLDQQESAKRTADWIEILGAVAMSSLRSHQIVVSDKVAMSVFVDVFKSNDLELLTSASHVLVDLLVTSAGREAFKHSSALTHLLHLLCRVSDFVTDGQEEPEDPVNRRCISSYDAGEPMLIGSGARKIPSKCDILSENESVQPMNFVSKLKISSCPGFSEECHGLIGTVLTAVRVLFRDSITEIIPRGILCDALQFLVRRWRTILHMDRLLVDSQANDTEEEEKWTGNRQTRHLVATCVVQVAMALEGPCAKKLSTSQCLFESENVDLNYFFHRYWEQAPLLMAKKVTSRFLNVFKSFRSLDGIAKNFLAWCVTCPAACADEVNPSWLFKSIENTLGEPMFYGQDIRMVKTLSPGNVTSLADGAEIHFIRSGESSSTDSAWHVQSKDILRAVEQGYTVAIKGMEGRCPEIAEAASCLSRQFGQPSIGVNLYLTPINEQGLQLHFDDHCVLVCQLVGCKTWNVYPPATSLPRLYASRALNHLALSTAPSTRFDIDEGDILYIPRGFPHKAQARSAEVSFKFGLPNHELTEVGESLVKGITNENLGSGKESGSGRSSSTPFSLHLTFGAEVEPPFEWEGMVHIALRIWIEERWRTTMAGSLSDSGSVKRPDHRLERVCEWLLQVSINILGSRNVAFRKACLILAGSVERSCSTETEHTKADNVPSPCGSDDTLECDLCDHSSITYFQNLVELVAKQADPREAFDLAGGSEDFYESCQESRLTWLRHIPHHRGHDGGTTLNTISAPLSRLQFEELIEGYSQSEIEGGFVHMKIEFGRSLMFHKANNAFRWLWNKYSTCRTQLTRGMLALHDGCNRALNRF